MGNKRGGGTRQVRRQQVRQVRPRVAQAASAAPAAGADRRTRERYVEAGGMLQGYAPEFVLRLGYYAAGVIVACVVIMAAYVLLIPAGLPTRIVAAAAWVMPIAFLVSFVLPAWRLARRDARADTRLVQGQLVGASTMSTSIGLGMIMVNTRAHGQEQYLVAPEKLTKVPGNQVQVVLTVTPGLRHVRSVGVMGQKLVPRPDQAIPEVVRRLRLLPLITPAALAGAVIVGATASALIPIPGPDLLHALITLVVAAALGAGVYGLSYLYQRRVYTEVQALMPGAA